MKRPFGVTVLAILCLVAAIYVLYLTLDWAALRWSREGITNPSQPWWQAMITHRITNLVTGLALVVFFLRLGWGLWKLENAARIGMALLILLNLLMLLAAEFVLLVSPYTNNITIWSPRDQVLYIGLIGLNALVVIYLFLPSIRRAFTQKA
jgi:hypothetical protein